MAVGDQPQRRGVTGVGDNVRHTADVLRKAHAHRQIQNLFGGLGDPFQLGAAAGQDHAAARHMIGVIGPLKFLGNERKNFFHPGGDVVKDGRAFEPAGGPTVDAGVFDFVVQVSLRQRGWRRRASLSLSALAKTTCEARGTNRG